MSISATVFVIRSFDEGRTREELEAIARPYMYPEMV
jgi:hypothetical protein